MIEKKNWNGINRRDCTYEAEPANIIRLREITKDLQFSEILSTHRPPSLVEFDVESGTSYMVGVYKNDIMAVSRVFSSAGTKFPEHVHKEWELVLVYTGEIHLCVDGKKRVLKPKEFYYLKPGQRHGAYYPKNTWVLCTTMPPSESFPEGG